VEAERERQQTRIVAPARPKRRNAAERSVGAPKPSSERPWPRNREPEGAIGQAEALKRRYRDTSDSIEVPGEGARLK